MNKRIRKKLYKRYGSNVYFKDFTNFSLKKFRRLVLQKDLTADNIVKIKNSLVCGSHPWIEIESFTSDGLYQDYMFTPERMPWSKESKKHYRDRLYGWAYVHFMYIQESDDNEFTYYGMKYCINKLLLVL